MEEIEEAAENLQLEMPSLYFADSNMKIHILKLWAQRLREEEDVFAGGRSQPRRRRHYRELGGPRTAYVVEDVAWAGRARTANLCLAKD